MPRVAVTADADEILAESTRTSGSLSGSAINRGPDDARVDVMDADADVDMAGPQVLVGEALDFTLERGEAVKARCETGETASFDVFVSDTV